MALDPGTIEALEAQAQRQIGDQGEWGEVELAELVKD
jgi:hypothetical protein